MSTNAFAPQGKTVVIDATASASTAKQALSDPLGASDCVISNKGPNDAYLAVGATGSVSAAIPSASTPANGEYIPAGAMLARRFPPEAYFSAICAASETAKILITRGDGISSGSGGSGLGGGDLQIGAVEIKDESSTVRANVKDASTLPAATDKALVTTLRDTPPVRASTPTSYRTSVAAADVAAAPGTVTCTKQAGGSATAGTYTVFVVAGNTYGRTTATQGNTTVTTETTNLTVRAAFAAVTGATFYDIYCSTDGAASKWVGRITETQRGTGIKITAVGVTGAGGTAGAVDVEVPGTGLAVNNGALTQNTAYIVPATPVDCSGKQYVDFDLNFSRTGDAVAPSLRVVPFFLNSRTSTYFAGDVQTINFGGASGAFGPMQQRIRVESRGNTGIALLVASIGGTGASLSIDAALN